MSQPLGGGAGAGFNSLLDELMEPQPSTARYDQVVASSLRLDTRLDLPHPVPPQSRHDLPPPPANPPRVEALSNSFHALRMDQLLAQPPCTAPQMHPTTAGLLPDIPLPSNLPTYHGGGMGSIIDSFYSNEVGPCTTSAIAIAQMNGIHGPLTLPSHSSAEPGPSSAPLATRYSMNIPQQASPLTPEPPRPIKPVGIRKNRRSRKREPGWVPIPREERVYKICPKCKHKNHVRCLMCRNCFMSKADMGKSSDRSSKLSVRLPD